MENRQMNNRILFLDYSRVIAAFLVVFAHLYTTDSDVRLYIYAFHMPFFYLVSGMLHKENSDIIIFKKCVKSLLIPAFFYLLVGLFVKCIFDQKNVLTMMVESGKNLYLGGGMPANSIVWFLFSLFNTKLLSNGFIHHGYKIKLIFIVLFLFFLVKPKCFEWFYFDTSLMAFPFFLLGYYIKDYLLDVSLEPNKWLFGFVLFGIITICITLYNGRVSMFGCVFGMRRWLIRVPLFYINGFIGSLMMICLSQLIKKRTKVCEIIAYSLISIVGFQEIFIHFYIKEIGQNQSFLISVLSSFVIIGLCCILHSFFKRFLPWAVASK